MKYKEMRDKIKEQEHLIQVLQAESKKKTELLDNQDTRINQLLNKLEMADLKDDCKDFIIENSTCERLTLSDWEDRFAKLDRVKNKGT